MTTELYNSSGVGFGVAPKGKCELAFEVQIHSDGGQITSARESWGTDSRPDLSPEVRKQIAHYLVLLSERFLAESMLEGLGTMRQANPNGKLLDPDEYLKPRH